MNSVRHRLQEVFRTVFDDPDLDLRDELTARDVAGWDSLTHINLIIAVEQEFGITLTTGEIARMREPDQSVGDLVRLVDARVRG